MVPNFALSLSFDGIALLRRSVTGWMQIDRVAFDDAALDQSLAALRSRATALSAEGAQVLLVLPSEQIRFLDIADPGPDDAAREAAVRAALDGATPYAVDELRYDWALKGDRLCAAAVALETLAEAESFVQAHGFTAMAFTTVPPHGAFEGTVWFGTAPGWSGATPERLRTPIEIVDAVPDVPWAAAARRTPDVSPAPVAPDTAEVDKTAPESAPAPDLPAADSAVATPAPGADDTGAPTPSPETAPAAPVAVDISAQTPAPEAGPAAPKRPVSAEDGTSGPEDAAPSEAEVPPLPAKRTVLPAPSADSEPPATPSFSSIRASRTAPTPASAPSLSATPAATASGSAPSVLAAAPTPNKSPRAISITPEATRKTPEQAPDKAPEKGPKADMPATVEGAAKPTRDPLQVAAMRRDRGEDPGPAKAQAAAASTVIDPEEERRRMTVFGARQQPIGGKPRYLGLMLTAALLLFMAAVAAWATVFLDEGISGLFQTSDEPTTIAANTSDEADSATADAEPEALLESAALSADPAPDAPEATDPEAASPSDTPAPAAEAISSDEAAASYAATGIWQRAPTAPRQPGGDTVDAVYLSSVDPEVGQFDAIALPPAPGLNDDIALEPVRLPPGPDTRFDLNPLGLVRATPEGAISPDGHRVFTGPPPQRPPQRTVEEPAPEASDAGEGDASEAETDDIATEDALRAVRPLDRPEDLIEQTERASLGGISRSELSDMRPVRRPESVSARAEETDPEAEDDATDTAVAPVPEGIATAVEEALEEPEVPSGTEQAVASSLEPQTRPGNMSSLVQQAARRAPEPAQTASAAPVRTQPAPRVPQNANVAREATTANQINLRDVNLIGVFGSASNRRALVRLSNGRLQNVKVGDRLDGGRVAAIGDSELRVAKSGRNIVLRMPGG
ncbi:hypothetical protein [Salipiger sp.]|uniref:hypothetical protein n=1 Tax=Salipiger sp. TaxID=2078585 RepID=UPI003A9736D4